ncbi:unnamed protein product [Lampetra fluviatilis]
MSVLTVVSVSGGPTPKFRTLAFCRETSPAVLPVTIMITQDPFPCVDYCRGVLGLGSERGLNGAAVPVDRTHYPQNGARSSHLQQLQRLSAGFVSCCCCSCSCCSGSSSNGSNPYRWCPQRRDTALRVSWSEPARSVLLRELPNSWAGPGRAGLGPHSRRWQHTERHAPFVKRPPHGADPPLHCSPFPAPERHNPTRHTPHFPSAQLATSRAHARRPSASA